jgi:hypothetical protein
VDGVRDEVENERGLGRGRLGRVVAVIAAATGERDDGGERGDRRAGAQP